MPVDPPLRAENQEELWMFDSRGRTVLVVLILLAGVVVAGSSLLFLIETFRHVEAASSASAPVDTLARLYERAPGSVLALVLAPLLTAAVLALVAGLGSGARSAAPQREATQPAAAAPVWSPTAALRLLGLLQQEGRLVDFLQEDIDTYSDAQVGAAVRSIHSGCRKALQDRVQLERIRDEADGATVEIGPDHDPSTVRLTGNVEGQPPFRGILQHAGWRVTRISLPEPAAGLDPTILEPAEVEIP